MLKYAFYEKDITPPLGAIIPGGFDPRYATDVKDNLYAKAVVLDDGFNTIAMLVIDAVSVNEAICDKITARILEYTGIQPTNIMICANHTHTGAPISKWCDKVRPDDDYVEMLCRLGADCVTLAWKRLETGTVKYGCGYVDSISFNRNYKLKDGTVMTNPGVKNPDIEEACGGIDPDVPMLFFENEAGIIKGAIISFACHQDCQVGRKTEYSGDFSSALSKELKKTYGENFVSFFVEGACGNINCIDVTKDLHDITHYVEMGKLLANEVLKIEKCAKPIKNDSVSSQKEYIKIKKRSFTEEQLEEAKEFIRLYGEGGAEYTAFDPRTGYIKLKFAYDALEYSKDKRAEADVCVQVFYIGGCLFYALPGEQYVQFGLYVKEHSPSDQNLIATLCNGSFGYIPTKEMFLPHVYESNLCTNSFLDPEAGYIIAEKLVEMGKNF